MSRGAQSYASGAAAPAGYQGFDPDKPVAGTYRTKLVRGGPFVAIRIWHGAPLDPVTGEELDRGHRWNAQANGRWIDIERVWPRCADEPINVTEYAYLIGLRDWAEARAPDSPHANPNRPVDLLTAPLPI